MTTIDKLISMSWPWYKDLCTLWWR